MPEGRKVRPLGRALQEVIAHEVTGHAERDGQAPGSGLFAHPSRAAVFQGLLDRPLSHVSQVAREIRASAPSARWHLAVLEQAGVVQTRRQGRALVAFVPGTADGAAAGALRVLRGERTQSVLAAVRASPGITVGAAAKAAGASAQTGGRAARALASVGLVEIVRDGRALRCYPGTGIEQLVDDRARALPGHAQRVQALLAAAGEPASIVRRTRDEVVLAVGRRGVRREFRLRAEAPLLPGGPPARPDRPKGQSGASP